MRNPRRRDEGGTDIEVESMMAKEIRLEHEAGGEIVELTVL